MEIWKQIALPVSQGGVLGAAFEWGARGPKSFDCWGLVVNVRKRLGLKTPDDWVNEPENFIAISKIMMEQSQLSSWKIVETPQPGNVMALSKNKIYHHAGILTPWGILHVSRGFGALIQDLSAIKRSGYSLITAYEYQNG